MRSRKKDLRNSLRVGIFLAAMTAVLAIMIVSIGKENSIFDAKVEIRARVTNVSNLKTGSSVELKGIRVGTIDKIEIKSEDEIEITATILKDQLKWIKQDSKVAISSAGLVGDKYLEIYNGTKDSPAFRPRKDVLLSDNAADFKKILSKGDSIATITERILSKVDQILLNMDDGKKIIDTMDSLNRTSFNLEQITKELKDAQLGGTMKSVHVAMGKMSKTAGSMERIMSRIENGPGTMNAMIYNDDLHEDLRALLGGAQRNKVIKYFIRESIKKSEQKKTED